MKNLRRRFAMVRCNKWGWHPQKGRTFVYADAVNTKARCARCGFVGLTDSQGNLF